MGVVNCNCNITDEELINDINSSMLSSSQIDRISTLFKVLGDPTRAKIVLALDNREVCVCTLANALGMTKSAVSHQLAILKANNIVKSRRDGKQVYYSFDDEHITDIIEIAQAADFHTVWISNQVKYGAWDTPVSVIADQSQTQYLSLIHI